MSDRYVWVGLTATERDCFDVCCQLATKQSSPPTTLEIYWSLCEYYQLPLRIKQVKRLLEDLTELGLLVLDSREGESVLQPTEQGYAILEKRAQELVDVLAHNVTPDMEVSQ